MITTFMTVLAIVAATVAGVCFWLCAYELIKEWRDYPPAVVLILLGTCSVMTGLIILGEVCQ